MPRECSTPLGWCSVECLKEWSQAARNPNAILTQAHRNGLKPHASRRAATTDTWRVRGEAVYGKAERARRPTRDYAARGLDARRSGETRRSATTQAHTRLRWPHGRCEESQCEESGCDRAKRQAAMKGARALRATCEYDERTRSPRHTSLQPEIPCMPLEGRAARLEGASARLMRVHAVSRP